ncbi:MAG: hypothetical protein V3S26_08945, partial [Acidimicrobiia bacterium]
RYGQCNNQVSCLGPIVCRVVTCVSPWEWDSSCTKTDAVAQITYSQGDPNQAPGLHPDSTPKGPYPARPAVVAGTSWQMRSTLSSGGADTWSFDYGMDDDVPLVGDYSNSGVRTVGMVRNQRHGVAGTQDSLIWYLRQVEGPGAPDLVVEYGRPGDIPVIGDWNGNGVHTVGVVRGNRWLLRNSNNSGRADYDFVFGEPGDIPVVGDWNGNGRSGIGVVRGNRWLLRNSLSSGPPDHDFVFGDSRGRPVTGDWDGDWTTGVGWYDSGTWQIRNALSPGPPDQTFVFGDSDGIPLAWGRNAW